jgi:hypothetical protein
MSRHFKIHELLDAKELAQLEEFAREPARTVDEVHEWMQSRGYTLWRSAAGNWLKEFKVNEAMSAAGSLAKIVLDAGKDTASISDAASQQLAQMIFEQSARLQLEETIETKELVNLSRGLKNVITGKRHIEQLREEMKASFDLQISAAQKKRPDGIITPEDIAAAKKAIFG